MNVDIVGSRRNEPQLFTRHDDDDDDAVKPASIKLLCVK